MNLNRKISVDIEASGATRGAKRATDALKEVDNQARRTGDGFDLLEKGGGEAAASMSLAGTAGRALGGVLAGLSIAAFAKSVFDAGVVMDSMERSFVAITGNSTAASAEMFFLREEADRLGQSFYDLAPQFKQIAASARGTALEGEQTRKIFSAITEASTALGLSSDETSGALNALSQMISKGTVQAEELRGQLGERLPGAFQLAARAMGVSTAELGKMLEQGQVLATDLLPKLADELHNLYGQAAETAGLESARAAVNRMSEEWTDLKNNMFHSETAVSGINMVTEALAGMNAMISQVQQGKAQYIWEGLEMEAMDPSKYRGKVNREMVMPAYAPPAASNSTTSGNASTSSAAKEVKAREQAYKKMIDDGQSAASVLDKYWADYEDARIKAITGQVEARTVMQEKEKVIMEDTVNWASCAAKAMEDTVSEAFQGMGDAIVDFAVTGKMEFSDFADSVVRDMMRIMVQQQIVGPLASGAGNFISDLLAGLSSAAGSGIAGELSSVFANNAKGGAYNSPSLSAYSNGIYDKPQLFAFAQGGVFGEAGPEAIMPLKRGADGSLGVRASGGSVNIVVNNNAPGTEAKAQVKDDGNGGKTIEVIVDELVSANLRRHGSASDRAIRSRFALQPALSGR